MLTPSASNNVGAAGEAGNGTAAVFCNGNAGRSGHQGSGGRDVESGEAAASAAGIHQFSGRLGAQGHAIGPHGLGKGGQFFCTGPLHIETYLKPRNLYICNFIVVNGGNQIENLISSSLCPDVILVRIFLYMVVPSLSCFL